MAQIVLLTFNARFSHTALGLRYLLANLGELAEETVLLEFELDRRPADVVEQIVRFSPKIAAISVAVWNVKAVLETAALLKQLCPHIQLVLGGPELHFEAPSHPLAQFADYIISGEGELEFAKLARALSAGKHPPGKFISAEPVKLADLALPYEHYSAEDLRNRVVYVECSRGCPMGCEFCLSAGTELRDFPAGRILEALEGLWQRGVRYFKFVDRSFNLSRNARIVLDFFHARITPDLFLHFEVVPDSFSPAFCEQVKSFPKGSLQLEAGIQTLNPEVAARIGRRQDLQKLEKNLLWLRRETGVHVHADLIAGLPGESLESFAAGFNHLLSLDPQEIQVGILKLLPGAGIKRHSAAFNMLYSSEPPREIMQNSLIDFKTMQKLKRMARYWDLVVNSGNFGALPRRIWEIGSSPFLSFLDFSDWLYAHTGRTHAIARSKLGGLLNDYLLAHGLSRSAIDEELEKVALRRGAKLPGLNRQAMRNQKALD